MALLLNAQLHCRIPRPKLKVELALGKIFNDEFNRARFHAKVRKVLVSHFPITKNSDTVFHINAPRSRVEAVLKKAGIVVEDHMFNCSVNLYELASINNNTELTLHLQPQVNVTFNQSLC